MSRCSKAEVEMHTPDILRKAGDITISGEQGKLGLGWFLSQTSPYLHIHTQTYYLMPTVPLQTSWKSTSFIWHHDSWKHRKK